jgi:hypothetical protein
MACALKIASGGAGVADTMIERVARKLNDLAPHRHRVASPRGFVPGGPVAWDDLHEADRTPFRAAAKDLIDAMRGLRGDEMVNFAKALSGDTTALPDTPARAVARREWLALIEAAHAEG